MSNIYWNEVIRLSLVVTPISLAVMFWSLV